MKRFSAWAASIVACFGLAACAALSGPTSNLPPVDPAAGYRLGSGDKVRVITFGEAALSGEFAVEGSGRIALPLAGEVQAAGLTATQLQAAVEKLLRGDYVQDPKVSVEVLTYRPYFILGEVNSPGQYPYMSGLTVLNAVATAKGFTLRANTKKVILKRDGGTTEKAYRLDPATPVAPGDTIRIPERVF